MNASRIIIAVLSAACATAVYGQVGNNSQLLNPNLATAAELEAVPGIDASTARAITAARPLSSSLALVEALGAKSPEELSALFGRVFLPLNLNSASREEIMLIPDMSPRMAHEFEEYRPYADMTDFDREIGKYVDEAEVARFRQYVTL